MTRHIPFIATLCVSLALAGCNSSSSDSSADSVDQTDSPPALPDLGLSATSHQLSVRLNWSGTDQADVYFARDPECDWDAYGSCPGGGLITDVTGDELTLAVEDGLASSQAHWFVIRTDDGRQSDMVAGRPWRAVPDNTVNAMALAGDTLYLGGRFDQLGAPLGGLALVDSAGNLTGALPWANGRVYASAFTAEGGLVVGGGFESLGGEERRYVAQIDHFGRVTDWTANIDDDVFDIALHGDQVFLGGEFERVAGDSQYGTLVSVSASDGNVSQGWNASVNGRVEALALTDEGLIAGGTFSTVNGESRRSLVMLHPETGATVDSWQGHTNNTVEDIAVSGSMVFAAGRFTEANDQSLPYLAAFDRNDGKLIAGWDAELDRRAEVLAYHEGRLYVAGRFDTIQGHDQKNVAALDASTGDFIETWRPDVPVDVTAIIVNDGRVYLGLYDPLEDGEEYVMVLDAGTGDRLDGMNLGLDHRVTHLNLLEDRMLIGGRFETGKPIPGTAKLVALDKVTGRVIADWTAPAIRGNNDPVHALALADDRLFLGGNFSSVDGVTLSNLAQVDRHTGALNTDWTPVADNRVDALQVDGERLYVGGNFTEIDSENRDHAAAFDLKSGALSTQWTPSLDGRVYAIEIGDGFLALGGNFATAEALDRDRLAVYNFNGDLITEFPDYEANSAVLTLLMEEGVLYAGGLFRSFGGLDRYRTAAIDLATTDLRTWHASIEPEYSSTTLSVRALASDPHAFYAGGRFSFESQGKELNHLGAFNRLSGMPLAWYPGIEDHRVAAMIADDGLVYVAGSFDEVAGHPARYLVVLEGAGYGPDAEVVW